MKKSYVHLALYPLVLLPLISLAEINISSDQNSYTVNSTETYNLNTGIRIEEILEIYADDVIFNINGTIESWSSGANSSPYTIQRGDVGLSDFDNTTINISSAGVVRQLGVTGNAIFFYASQVGGISNSTGNNLINNGYILRRSKVTLSKYV